MSRLRCISVRVMLCFVLLMGFVAIPAHAQIAASTENFQAVSEAAGVNPNQDLVQIVGRIIYIFLGLLGTIFLVLMLYAGYLWMTAAGDPAKVEKAKATIRNAIIGIVIIASAFAITNFILKSLSDATGGGVFGGKQGPGGFLNGAVGSLGGAVIESVYPAPNTKGVVRNTSIIVTFKEPIKPESIIEGWTMATSNTASGLNVANVKIYRSDAGPNGALTMEKVRAKTVDFKTYVFKPVFPPGLGSPTDKVSYTVTLAGGANGILKIKNNEPAFSGAFGKGYYWQFETSTVIDLTPPKLISAIPQQGGEYARNVIVQMTFNEAVDPTATTGKTADGFQNIQVTSGDQVPVSGEYRISNQYQTVEFIPDDSCGMNSCNKQIFCLPPSLPINVLIKAANLDPKNLPQALWTQNGYDGVVDVASNSFDGNNDGVAQGPLGNPADNYSWAFKVTGEINLTPPVIKSTVPASDPQLGQNSNIPLDQSVIVNFDSVLQASTVTTDNAKIDAHGWKETDPDTFWWTDSMRLLNSNGGEIDVKKNEIATQAALVISHRPYLPSGDKGVSELNLYDPYIYSGVQNIYQNCFNPAASCTKGKTAAHPNCCNFEDVGKTACKTILHP
ncbi:hypothetical protein KBC54_00400 [Patescibacteria group bacterium]|nr:hypothetical protein [Patescibacteria group bacterium]